jgi:hypothetical protein
VNSSHLPVVSDTNANKGVGMDKYKSLALIGAISTVTAIFASIRGDLAVAAPMFFVAAVFSRRARRGRTNENA